MKEQKFYVCEYCNTKYKEKRKAVQCEKNHHSPKSFGICNYNSIIDSYPDWIEILFDNGKCFKYRR